MTPFYRGLAQIVDAYLRSKERRNAEWTANHCALIKRLVREIMPSGSGIDNGVSIDLERSSGECLVFITAFHHMDDAGGYDGWTEHTVFVKASLMDEVNVRISGDNRNDIKDHLHEVFRDALMTQRERWQ